MSSGCRRRMMRLPGPEGTTGTERTGGTDAFGCAALLAFSGVERSGLGCVKNALIPCPVEDFRFLVSSSSSIGGRLLAIDNFLHDSHISLGSLMLRLIYDQRDFVPG